jgi:predicted transcriptional regulator
MENVNLITHTADIVAAHLSNNKVPLDEVAALVQRVHGALASLGQPIEETPAEKVPVVSVRASVKPDYIVCMECGAKQKMLRRHIQTAHGMSPADYRKDYGLPDTYPMVAPNYSERRAELAKSIGLGRKKGEKPAPKTQAKGRGRPRKQAADKSPAGGEA